MTKDEKIYTGLSVLFTSLLVLGNLTYQKFIVIKTPLHHFELSVGAVLYPLTFLLTDLITELY
ncbi:MAG: queuosine precursor transporter, partial [Holosporales bacterium]